MKGKTRIELTDVNTGEKEIHEDENMFTNALQEIYNNNFLYYGVAKDVGYFGTLIRDLTSYESIIGGIFCLDKKLDEDASIIEVPDGVTITAHAGAPYTGNSSMRGTLNTTESGEVDNGYKFVWDFATNQGNGKIACVGLTTSMGGNNGDDFNVEDGSISTSTLYSNATGYKMYSASGGYLEFRGHNGVIDDDNYLWCATTSSSTVVYLRKSSTPYPLTSPILKKYGSDVMTSFYLDEQVILTLPVSINTSGSALRLSIDNGNIYIIATANSSSNGIYVFEVDWDNGVVTNYYNVPSSIIDRASSNAGLMGRFVSIANGYLYYANSSNCVEKIDFKNAEVILASPSYSESVITLACTEFYGFDYNGHVFWGGSTSSSSYYYYYYYWDEENNKIHRLGKATNNYYSGAVKWLSPFYMIRLGSGSSSSSTDSIYESIFAAAKPLLTINNLESAVTKTSAQTMKITYTVTEN